MEFGELVVEGAGEVTAVLSEALEFDGLFRGVDKEILLGAIVYFVADGAPEFAGAELDGD